MIYRLDQDLLQNVDMGRGLFSLDRNFLQTMAASQNIYFYIFAIFFIIGLIDCELRPLKEHDRREQDFDVKPGGDVQIVEETWVKTATNWAII